MAVDEMKLISFEFKEKYNDLLEAIKKNSSKINRILNETLCRLYNQPPLGSNAYLYRAFRTVESTILPTDIMKY